MGSYPVLSVVLTALERRYRPRTTEIVLNVYRQPGASNLPLVRGNKILSWHSFEDLFKLRALLCVVRVWYE